MYISDSRLDSRPIGWNCVPTRAIIVIWALVTSVNLINELIKVSHFSVTMTNVMTLLMQ